jgi:hypothetical protein
MFILYSYVLEPNKFNSLLFMMFLKSPNLLTHSVFQHPVALYRSDFAVFVPSKRNVVHCSFFVFLYWTLHVWA